MSPINIEPHVLIRPDVAAPLPYFSTSGRISALEAEAELWRGTPWCANSDSRGPDGGVSCHNLPRALYVATGALPETFPKLTGYPSRHARESVVETLLDARPEFMRVPIDDVRAGDLVGLRLFYCTDHLGVVVNHDLCFVHVLVHKLTTIDRLREDPTWSSRLRAAWRPVQ